ncbi:hypothetical protein RM780_17055 [Streptomyces sp. DSM 44917]|uniref:Uncharacterized protein n=1 Tax=Streptomyces boetiae TaxID=3075541 RepID=A0ABU2LAQ5_9ACTN|nr:hypothetical protein [Streptomyces sp. DSM 44917]MDT0308656.1 hypothetical protein [Streptomyces sp. DSM 44917]
MARAESRYRVLDADEAERRFALASRSGFPYLGPARQEIRLYEGGWHVRGDLLSNFAPENRPYHVIVDGDLTVEGTLDWATEDHPSVILVTGDLRARAVLLSGSPAAPELVVQGTLRADHGVLGYLSGPRGGRLRVAGRTETPVVLAIEDFTMTFAHPPAAAVLGDAGSYSGPPQLALRPFDEALHENLLRADGEPDPHETGSALAFGRPVLRAAGA